MAFEPTAFSEKVVLIMDEKIKRIVELIERALKARIPCVGIIDSEGIIVEDVIGTPSNYSNDRIMSVQATAPGVIPQISPIMGPCKGAA